MLAPDRRGTWQSRRAEEPPKGQRAIMRFGWPLHATARRDNLYPRLWSRTGGAWRPAPSARADPAMCSSLCAGHPRGDYAERRRL